MRAPLII